MHRCERPLLSKRAHRRAREQRVTWAPRPPSACRPRGTLRQLCCKPMRCSPGCQAPAGRTARDGLLSTHASCLALFCSRQLEMAYSCRKRDLTTARLAGRSAPLSACCWRQGHGDRGAMQRLPSLEMRGLACCSVRCGDCVCMLEVSCPLSPCTGEQRSSGAQPQPDAQHLRLPIKLEFTNSHCCPALPGLSRACAVGCTWTACNCPPSPCPCTRERRRQRRWRRPPTSSWQGGIEGWEMWVQQHGGRWSTPRAAWKKESRPSAHEAEAWLPQSQPAAQPPHSPAAAC